MPVLPQQQHAVPVVDGDDTDGADVLDHVALDGLHTVADRHLHLVDADTEDASLVGRGRFDDRPALRTVADVARAELLAAHDVATVPVPPSRASA
ncbi:hypothetical protein [Actinomadura madurae]|uniref:hypothetical protein n=1 Tax=Actinomadura madurae TaxID=1993 RepID=UPI0027E26B74|nr:hypothetical protein [Actinomadura madurae]